MVYRVGMATRAAPVKQSRSAPGRASTVRSTSPIWLWPSLRQAAVLLRVDPATLSRRKVVTEQYGQERRLARSLDELESLEADVERYLAASRSAQRESADDAWLAEAQRRLPGEVYDRVLEVVGGGEPVESFRGVRFDEDEDG